MKFHNIESYVGDTPFIGKLNAKYLYDLIVNNRMSRILELGIAHGTATCYMAAALHELGSGLVTAVDLVEPIPPFNPSAEGQLKLSGLTDYAEVVRMQSGYNWFLHDDIVKQTTNGRCEEVYDLCIIDGPKNWTIDGAAFFLVDKLLKKNGWLIFDDYEWTYGKADRARDATDGITHRRLSKSELETPQIREIFELLVRQHPNYSNFTVWKGGGDWAIAQKTASDSRTYTLLYEESYKDVVGKLYGKARRLFRGLSKR